MSNEGRAAAPFHYSFHVTDLAAARRFYGGLLGCAEGRSTASWVDFDFFGNQLSLHLGEPSPTSDTGKVDGIAVPMPHFGAVIGWKEFQALAEKLTASGIAFVVTPRVRFAGEPGEQATMFFRDPSGNALELKALRDPARVFAR